MLSRKELDIFRGKVSLMYRFGRLGLGSLMSCAIALMSRKKGDISASEAYLGLYGSPKKTVRRLFRTGLLTASDLASNGSAWAKALVSRRGLTAPPVGYVPPMSDILNYFEDAEKCGKFDLHMQKMFTEIIGDRLYNSFLFTEDDHEKRLDALLDKVNCDAVLRSRADLYFKHFLLSRKLSGQSYRLSASGNDITIEYDEQKLAFPKDAVRCRVHRVRRSNDMLSILCEVQCPVFGYLKQNEIFAYAVINGTKKIKLELLPSCGSYYNSFEKISSFYYFSFETNITSVQEIVVEILVAGQAVPAVCYAEKSHFFSACLTDTGYNAGDKNVTLEQGKIFVRAANVALDSGGIIADAGKLKDRRIWLYSDYSSVREDNGYYQFSHDCAKNDGVKRYYVTHDENDAKKENFVLFGSREHRVMFLAAEKIFAAFVDAPNCLIPFDTTEFPMYSQVFHGEIIYLQHGVLHAHIPWRYSPVSTTYHADKIVVSSEFEIDNFTKNYHFPRSSLIPSGMPRYDRIPRKNNKGRCILYAPSWRAYMDDDEVKKFISRMNELLDCHELSEFLEKNDIYLHFKPHPLFERYYEEFDLSHDGVTMVKNANVEDYSAFITDFSSYVFDFVKLGIPVVYFFPDYDDFCRGKYQYSELDLPFDKAFGSLVFTAEDTVAELKNIAENGYEPKSPYKERMENFFLPLENCCEKIYENAAKK